MSVNVEEIVGQMCSIVGEFNKDGNIDGEMTARIATLIRTTLTQNEARVIQEKWKYGQEMYDLGRKHEKEGHEWEVMNDTITHKQPL